MTGQPAAWYMTWNNSANSMAQYMAAQLAANHAVTAGTPGTSVIPIIPGHAYNVHSVSQDTNGVWWITVYNPWGIDNGHPEAGLVWLTRSEVTANYSSYSRSL